MHLLKIVIGLITFSTITACSSSAINNSSTLKQLYAVETDPIGQWPEQSQRDISILEQDFVNRYQRDYPQGEVHADYLQLSECPLEQSLALDIAGISPATLNPPSTSANLINDNTITYQRISIRSTAEGCRTLNSATIDVLPNMTADIRRLAGNTPYPVYIDAAYLQDLKSRVNINGKWTKTDYGLQRVSLKRYRHASGIQNFPYLESLWQKTETLRQGDTNTSRFKEQPLYQVTYFTPPSDSYIDVTLNRQTLLNKTGNNITFRWKEGADILSRTWTRQGTVLSQRNGKQHGLFSIPVDNQPGRSYCHDQGERVDYFGRQGDYDCVAVSESEYGQEGVLMDPNVALREKLANLRNNHPDPAPIATVAPDTPINEPSTATDVVTNTATECTKAYAARKACEKIPGDPFGIAMKVCLNAAKKKFGGLNCPVNF